MYPQCSETVNETETLLAPTAFGKGVRKQSESSSGFSMRSKSGQCFRTKAVWHPEVPSQIQAANLPAAWCSQCHSHKEINPGVFSSGIRWNPSTGPVHKDSSLEGLKSGILYSLPCPGRGCIYPGTTLTEGTWSSLLWPAHHNFLPP